MPTPSILDHIVRFHRQHNLPVDKQPQGQLHHNRGTQTLGYMRGSNLAAAQKVKVYTAGEKKLWEGEITEGVDDDWTPDEGPAWFFQLQVTRWEADPDQDDTIVVTVTVTDPPSGSTSDPTTAQPNPADVP